MTVRIPDSFLPKQYRTIMFIFEMLLKVNVIFITGILGDP